MGVHDFWLVYMVFRGDFKVISWFLVGFNGTWFFKVVSCFLVGFHGFSRWFHGFSWFLIGFHGFSRFPGGFSLSLMVPGWLNLS